MYRHLTSAFAAQTRSSQFSLRHPSHFSSSCTDPKFAFLYEQLEKTITQPISNREPLAHSKAQSKETRTVGKDEEGNSIEGREVVISHPWLEWAGLLELLLKKDYLDLIGLDDLNRIRTGCLRFARDRPDLVRYLSRKDIHVVAGCGCANLDRKVVNAAKRLRAHLGIDEIDVCSRCSLRGNCERAYEKARRGEYGQTVDVMRILLTYGLDPNNGLVQNQTCLNKPIKESVKKLMGDMVELCLKQSDSSYDKPVQSEKPSFVHRGPNKHQIPMKQGDWMCPMCNFMNFAKNMKCLKCNSEPEERYNILQGEQECLPLKPGDWICQKCNFLNFAKNTECLQCREKPTNHRSLNTGEWECHSCYYVNFKRNEHCRRCGWKRPKSLNVQDNNTIHCQQGYQDSGRKPTDSFVRDAIDSDISHFSPIKSLNRKNEWSNNTVQEVDFPIVGGKSYISRDPFATEKWKEEMHRRSKGILINDTGVSKKFPCYSGIPRSMELDESTDDEMASWFIPERNDKDCY